MSRLTEAEKHGEEELIFPCDAIGCGHYLRLSWDDEDEEYRYLFIEQYVRRDGMWDRIKGAARLLRGREHSQAAVLLSDESARNLRDFLMSKLMSRGGPVEVGHYFVGERS